VAGTLALAESIYAKLIEGLSSVVPKWGRTPRLASSLYVHICQ
jgi:hypothetical protein